MVSRLSRSGSMALLAGWFGSQVAIANALMVSEPAVSQWFSQGWVPPARAIQIEEITRGDVKASDIVGEMV